MSRRILVDPRFPATLRELREARGLSLRALANRAYCSKSTISALENGTRSPARHMVEHLDRVLNAEGELTAMVAEPSADGAPRTLPLFEPVTEVGQPIEGGDIGALRQSIVHLIALDNAYGGDDISRVALRAFRNAHKKLATGAYEPKVEVDLQAVVGEVGELTAWLLYDADRQDESRRVNVEALTVSRLAGDRAIELLELANLAMQSVHLRRGREALRIAEHVLGTDRLSPRVAGLFQLRRARALANLGDRPGALDALAQARAAISEGAADNDPPWAWWIDQNELTWHAAMLHSDLRDHSHAVDLFRATTHDPPPVKRRGHYNNLAHLLDALTTVAAWQEAEPVMLEVLPLVDEIGSTRTERLLSRAVTRIERAEVPTSLSDLAHELAARLSTVP